MVLMKKRRKARQDESLAKPPFYLACWVCGLAALFYGYEDILRVLPGTMAAHLFRDLHINAGQLGFMASLFYVGYAPMQIPAGLLLDRFGPRRCLMTAALLAAVATAVFALTPQFWVLSMSRFWIGVASSVAYLASLILASRWFDGRYFVMVAGLVQLVGCVGSLVGQAPVAWLMTMISWRQTTLWIAAFCVVLAVLFYGFLRDMPPALAVSEAQDKTSWPQLWRGLGHILKQSQTWAAGMFAFLVWAPISVFAVLWGIPFFHDSYQLSETQAGLLMAAVWVGVALGGPVFGWWSNAIGRRCVPMAVGGCIGAAASFALVYGGGHPTGWWVALLFLLGVASSSQAVSFGVVFDRQPQTRLGAATGFNNMAVVMGGFLLQPMVGVLLTYHARHGQLAPMPVYHLVDYQYALWVLPVCYLLSSLVALIWVKETHCQKIAP